MKKKKILIVEDDPGVIDMLELLLDQAGYTTLMAQDGREGLAKAIKYSPDLIITDILMPVMDGYTFFKELKKSQLTRHIPVLILTARGQMHDTFEVLGADAFIEKPSESQWLLLTINELLTKTKKSQKSKRILLAGSNPEIVKNMVEQFKNKGLQCDYVFTGPDIISQSVLFNPHIIIMEVQMSIDRSSSDIIKAIRLMPRFKSIPILVYSYYDVGELGVYEFHQKATMISKHQQRCLRAGATKYIGRFEETIFWECIAEYLS